MEAPFLPKEDQRLPNSYGIKVFYVDGTAEEFNAAAHRPDHANGILEIWTSDDLCRWIFMPHVLKLQFDKNFSKMVAIKAELDRKAKEAQK